MPHLELNTTNNISGSHNSRIITLVEANNMTFTIEPLELEDTDAVLQVFWRAFEPLEADMILPMVYPQGLQPEVVVSLRKYLLAHHEGGSPSYGFCARDSVTREIMAISHWTVNTDPPSEADGIQKAYDAAVETRSKRLVPEGKNTALEEAFFKVAFSTELETMAGRSYVDLGLLATDPKYQGKGAGKALLAQGLSEVVDKLALPCYVLASRSAKPLYEKAGCELKDVFPFDCRKYGGRSEGKHWIMVRPAQEVRSNH